MTSYAIRYTCPRCGIQYLLKYERTQARLCRDCKAVLSKPERTAWTNQPEGTNQ